MLSITAFYAALLAVLFLFLSVRVIGWRRERRVEFGHGEDIELLRRMRVHANFAEYVPFTLLLMALAESMAPPHLLLHLAGLLLVAGRLLHAYGVSQSPAVMRYRIWGMWLTFIALGLAALICLSLSALFLAV
ncbi:MAG TPA: MAPEG family protein [Hyphomicrobium sp.]|jgi:hypothetical protein